jgi:glycosyltransferase involved in cell wall biosynthesis
MRCGVGDYTERLVSALGDDRVDVYLLTSIGAAAERRAGVLPEMTTWHRDGLARFHDVMRRVQPEVVHIQFPTQGYDSSGGLAGIALLSRLKYRVGVVVTLHEYLPRTTFRNDRSIYALALAANAIVVVRPEYRARTPWPQKALVAKSKLHFIESASVLPVVALTEAERRVIKERLGCRGALVTFFGFCYPHKGVDLLFEIADPEQHHLLIIGELRDDDPYHARLRSLASAPRWQGNVTLSGFTTSAEAARLLAASDAAVFPYRGGGGIWNSSLHAALAQGTFSIATSLEASGYNSDANVYYARPDDVSEMRRALLAYQGVRSQARTDSWSRIARQHEELYSSLTRAKATA